MDYKAVVTWGKLNIIGTSIRLNYYNILVVMVVLVEVDMVTIMAVVVDTRVEMAVCMVVVVEDHSISIQMEQKHLDGSKMENVKLNL